MEPDAVAKAKKLLEKARLCLGAVESCKNFEEFEEAWPEFLVALHRAYMPIDSGSKTNPRSRQWYGRKKNFGKADPLLKYIHEARNEEYHHFEKIAQDMPGMTIIRSAPGARTVAYNIHTDGQGRLSGWFESTGSEPPKIERRGPFAKLLPIKNEYGNIFHPPTEHLGQALIKDSPAEIARLAFAYYEALISEAASMA